MFPKVGASADVRILLEGIPQGGKVQRSLLYGVVAAERKIGGQARIGRVEVKRQARSGPEPVEAYHQGKFPDAKR